MRRLFLVYPLALLVVLFLFALSPSKAFAVTNGKISYFVNNGYVVVMNADGSGKTQLTTDGHSMAPSFAPNGSKIMYWNTDGDGYIGLINPDGSDNQPNVVSGAYSYWLPNSTRLMFIDFSSGFEPKTMNIDGSDVQPLSWMPGFEGPLNAIAFSPDGSKISYANPDGEGASLYIADATGSSPDKINSVGFAALPNFSPDGETIYFVGYSGGETYSLYSVNIDGSNETELSTLPTSEGPMRLVISPDGTKLQYASISQNGNNIDVYTMNVDGTNQVKVIDNYTGGNAGVTGIGWSPDSTMLVFTARPPSSSYDVFTIKADGTGLTNLTNTPDDDEMIAYTSQAWGAGPEAPDSGSSDTDQDNISDTVENAAPNSGDANNDGTPDSEQSNVSSLVDPVSGEYAVLEVSDECSVTSVSIGAESANTTQDSDFSYPNGLMDFTLDCGTNGFTVDVTQYYYGQDSKDFIVRKYNPSTNTYTTIDQAEISQETIDSQSVVKATYQVKDGSSLDLDGEEDGNIHDPVGLATATGSLADTGQNTQNIVLLATILLTSGLAVSTYIFNNQRKHNV
ncbi:MAG TPA: hypothetical protein PKB09_03265 [Candidatus Saccharibacteria bacterium]|nr:hypothetical protein [Candidatus Saccharibacteria bacterium]